MKKLHAAIALIALGLGSNAFAYDAQVNFSGLVTDKTCDINGSSVRPAAINVNLPTVGVNALSSVGSWAGRTPFAIALTNCTAANTTVKWEPMLNVDAATGALQNTASGGSNVLVQVLDDSFAAINMTSDAGRTADTSSGSATLNYYAQYFAANAAATAGAVKTFGYVTLTY